MAARSGERERARGQAQPPPQAQPQAGDSGTSPPAGPHPHPQSRCCGCLSRAVPEAGLGLGLGLSCPICRRADTRRRKALPLPGRRRKREEEEERLEPEPVFRAPLVLSKAGEVREEFENHLRQYEAEKESLKEDDETVTAEIIQIILAEGEQEKQQMEKKKAIAEQVKRDEELARKWSREFTADNMSDSENEEPVKRMSTRQRGSAANSKLGSNSSGRITSMLCTNSEECRSWSTPVENNQIRRATPRSDSGTKTASLTNSSLSTNALINILSSSENSRSNSAPDLSLEKRTLSDPSLSAPAKRERSVSPDSNDSISEELNHFKPIMCSPCTPPKKLPDGRLLKPKIVKSTPRNLGCTLQKATTTTTYEVNPKILEKWGQILKDRREAKTASKGTLTSEEEEEEEEAASQPVLEKEVSAMVPPVASHSPSPAGVEQSDPPAELRTMDCSDSAEVPDSTVDDPAEWEATESNAGASPVRHEGVEQEENELDRDSRGLTPAHTGEMHSRGVAVASSSTTRGSGSGGPSSSRSHRGRKRYSKTKHTAADRSKRAKWSTAGHISALDPVSLTVLDRARQEEEDRKLAFRLQRRFDLERTTVNRRKGSEDSYLLRTKVFSSAK